MINLKCSEYAADLQVLFSEYVVENLGHNKCCHCNKPIIPNNGPVSIEAEIEDPHKSELFKKYKSIVANHHYEMHEACVESFLQYWSVTLFEDFKPIDNKANLVVSALALDLLCDHLDSDIIAYIIKQLGNQVLEALPSGVVIRDSYLSIEVVNEGRMQQYVRASVRFFPVCMFCQADRKLITPKHYTILNEADQIFPLVETIQVEDLKQTEDGKYIFHNSCLNNTINSLKCYRGGANEE